MKFTMQEILGAFIGLAFLAGIAYFVSQTDLIELMKEFHTRAVPKY